MELVTLHLLIADKIRDTGEIITNDQRDRALSAVLVNFNASTSLNASTADPASLDDFHWQQIANLTAADLLEQMANYATGDIAGNALGRAIDSDGNRAADYRASANRLRRTAYNALGWQFQTAGSSLKPASVFVEV